MTTAGTGTIRFGEFALDPRSGELLKDGRRVRLQDQPLKILLLLLGRPGEMLTREELRQQLWPAETFVSFDAGLNTAIKKLRQALDDEADHPRFVETLPRRGYRFIGSVMTPEAIPVASQTTAGAPPVTPPAPLAAAAAPRIRARRWVLFSATAAAIVIAASLVGRVEWLSSGRSAGPAIHSIAILPLDDLSGNAAEEYFADGMTDELTTVLAKLPSLRVISRTSVQQYKSARKPASEIGRALNVDALVEGSVLRADDRVRITVQLIEAASDRHLFAESYERKLEDVLALQRDVAESVARQVNIVLTPDARASLGDGGRIDPGAYDDYLRAKFYLRRPNQKDNQAAIALLERAVARNPGFALAYAELGRAYSMRGFRYEPQRSEWQERAYVAVEEALALDPNLADAHMSRGVFLWTHQNHFPHEQAIREQRRAVALNPNLAEAHQQLAQIYNHIGFFEEALKEAREAARLNPSSTVARNRIGESLLFLGRYDEALAAYADALQEGDLAIWRYQAAVALIHLGRRNDATRVVEDALRSTPNDQGGLLASAQAMIAAADGDNRMAEEKIHRAVEGGQGFGHFHHTAYAIALAYATMNRPTEAMKWLESAVEDGFPCYPLINSDPALDRLRQHPQFVTFLARLKARWEQYRQELAS